MVTRFVKANDLGNTKALNDLSVSCIILNTVPSVMVISFN